MNCVQTADIGTSLSSERTHVSPWLVVRMHKRASISYALFLSAESLTEDGSFETTERPRRRLSLAQPFPERSDVKGSRDSSVGIVTGYGLDCRVPDQICGSPSLTANGYRGLFPRG
jgi:hypothetical protein